MTSHMPTYAEAFGALEHTGPAWLPSLRRAAFDRFTALGFPTTRNEDWHFTSVTPIAERAFGTARAVPMAVKLADLEPHTFGDASWRRLTFVNGRFEPSLSAVADLPAGIRVSTFADAFRESPEFIAEHLGKLAAYGDATFTALNTALVQDGVVIHVPRDLVVEKPVHLLYLTDAHAEGIAVHPRVLVVVEARAQLVLVESYAGAGGVCYFTNAVAEIEVGNGARVYHYKVQREGIDAFHVGTIQVSQGRDSLYHSFSFAGGAALSRTNVYSTLDGEGAEVRLNGLYMVDGTQQVDHQTSVKHLAPNTASRELYKGVLDGSSHGVFNGKVYVAPVAQKTDGKQTNHTLLLSEHARTDTKPQLEIFADDVKCTHGATVGRLDDVALFYMKSRGIGADSARSLLTYAFAAEVLETIELDPLRTGLEERVFERFTHAPLHSGVRGR